MAAQNEKADKYPAMFSAIPVPWFTASPLEETLTQAQPVTSK